jgi:hypothetical protein
MPSTTSIGEWMVCIAKAHTYLQQKISPKQDGAFPFLRLPAELRSVIYDMVFQYPVSGLLIRRSTSSFRTRTQILTWPFSIAAWSQQNSSSYHGYGRYKQSFPEALNLLLVNKQIFEETFPCLFRLNLFYFTTCYTA